MTRKVQVEEVVGTPLRASDGARRRDAEATAGWGRRSAKIDLQQEMSLRQHKNPLEGGYREHTLRRAGRAGILDLFREYDKLPELHFKR